MELLFYLGVLLPTLVVVVAFIVFLLCWFRSRLPFLKERRRRGGAPVDDGAPGGTSADVGGLGSRQLQQQQLPYAMPPLPPVPQPLLQQRGGSLQTGLDQQPDQQRQPQHQPQHQQHIYALDDDGRLLWDKYAVRDSMHSVYFGDRPAPVAGIPASITFPALAGLPMQQHRLQQQQNQQLQLQQHHFHPTFAKSASCLFQTAGRRQQQQHQMQQPPQPPPPPPQPSGPAGAYGFRNTVGGRRPLYKSNSMEQPVHGLEGAATTGQQQPSYPQAFGRTRGRDASDHRLYGFPAAALPPVVAASAACARGGPGVASSSRDNSAGTSDPRTPSESASESERSHLVRPLPLRVIQQPPPPPPPPALPTRIPRASPDSSAIGESST